MLATQLLPLIEPDRFYAAPRSRAQGKPDAQSRAIERLVARCERVIPHLRTADTLEAFVRAQPDPVRVRKRIALALAIELGHQESAYGFLVRRELETFRALARRKLAAVMWVFG